MQQLNQWPCILSAGPHGVYADKHDDIKVGAAAANAEMIYYFSGLVYQNLHIERLRSPNGKRVNRRSSKAICKEEYQ